MQVFAKYCTIEAYVKSTLVRKLLWRNPFVAMAQQSNQSVNLSVLY